MINNVCFSDENPFKEISENSVHTMITVNCYAMTLLTKLVIEKFKKRNEKLKKHSLIINSCAGASIAPIPYVQMYSATKIFCQYMTEGL